MPPRKRRTTPGLDRATLGLYPPGSTWKPVTALAAMQEHLLSPYESIQCTPEAKYGIDEHVFKNWDPYVNRPMTLTEALAQSCDTYFYAVGDRFYERGPATGWSRLQDWAAALRVRHSRRARHRHRGVRSRADARMAQGALLHRRRGYTAWDRAWNPGDSILLAIGQKDLTVTPLQMARFYAMLANGGKLVTPYTVSAVEQRGAKGQSPVPLRPVRAHTAAYRVRRPGRGRRDRPGAVRGDAQHERARRPASSAPSRSRSPARRGRRRRLRRCPATRRPLGGPVVVVRLGTVRRTELRAAKARSSSAP